MPFSDLQALRDALRGFVVAGEHGRRLRLPPDGLGWEPLAVFIRERLPLIGGELVLDPVSEPEIVGDAVVLSGQFDSWLGQPGALVAFAFDLADGGQPSLLVRLDPTDPRQPFPIRDWNLGNSFPTWALLESPLTSLRFEAPAFLASSIARAAAPSRPALERGLSFAAETLKLDGPLAPLEAIPQLRPSGLEGRIDGTIEAPHTLIASAPIRAIPFGYLDLPVRFGAVSTDPDRGQTIDDPPPAVATWLQLSSELRVGGESVPPIPLLLRFERLGSLLRLVADLRAISTYGLDQFATVLHDAPIGSYLSGVIDLPRLVELRDLSVSIATRRPVGIAAVGLSLGTARRLVVVEGWVELPDVQVDFMVDDPAGRADITAVLSGEFDFLDGIAVTVRGIYPQLLFTGSVDTDPPIPFERIVRRFLPTLGSFPDISLSRLTALADLTARRYAFELGVRSGWQIPIGIASFQLEEATLSLGYLVGASQAFSGELTAEALLLGRDGREIARFGAGWVMPSTSFLLEGEFPEISLTALAETLTGGSIPASGLPQIFLRDSRVRFEMQSEATRALRLTGTTTYEFSLGTTIDAEKIGQADLALAVRRGSGERDGVVVGLVVRPDWTPDAIWSGLSDVFDVLTVRDAGLILSSIRDDDFSLPNLRGSWVPDRVRPGVTFFAALLLDGDALSILRGLFSSEIEFDLLAYIDTSDLKRSEIAARLPADDGKGAISFTGLELAIKPGAGEFSLAAGAIFTVAGERVTLEGSGVLRIGTTPSASFAIGIANWREPFGIKGLTLETFGLSFSVSTGTVAIGLLGSFLIGSDPRDRFRFAIGGSIVDFEAPGGFVFKLESASGRALKVMDLVHDFTSVDLRDVPLLNGLAFTRLDLFVVADPGGWDAPDHHRYEQGIGVDADLTLYDEWRLRLKLEANKVRGLLADGSISNAIVIGDLLVISDYTGRTGPSVHIDTSGLKPMALSNTQRIEERRRRLTQPLPEGIKPAVLGINPYTVITNGEQSTTYFAFSGAIRLLGIKEESFAGSVTDGGFEVNFHTKLANLYSADFSASLSRSDGFAGHAEGRFDFSLDFPDGVSIGGIRIIPPVVVRGPRAFLSIDLALSLGAASAGFALSFDWGPVHIAVDFHLTVTAELLARLWDEIVVWIRSHVEQFFADILDSAERFVELLRKGFLWAGQTALEIVRILAEVFSVDNLVRMAQLLVDAARFVFTEMVDALMEGLGATFEAAVAALQAIGDFCAMAVNESVLYGPQEPPAITTTTGGTPR